MGDLLFDERENIQSAREALLESYSSKSAAHGTYILTLGIAVFTVLQIFRPVTTRELSQVLTASAIVASLLVLIFQMSMRALYWGRMTATIICIEPSRDKDIDCGMREAVRRGEVKPTTLYRLENACSGVVQDKGVVGFFNKRWLGLKVGCALAVIFCISFSLTYGFYILSASP